MYTMIVDVESWGPIDSIAEIKSKPFQTSKRLMFNLDAIFIEPQWGRDDSFHIIVLLYG